MERALNLQKLNMRITLALWSLLCIGCMSVMLYAASHKTVQLVENAGERINIAEDGEGLIWAYSAQKLAFQEDQRSAGIIRIPLERSIRAEDIVIDNHYTDRQLRIYMKGADHRFYKEKAVAGDLAGVSGGECLSQDGGIVLIIHMDEAYEYQTTLENGVLTVHYLKMSEAYTMVVVADPAGGGEEAGNTFAGYSEKDITLNVALLLTEKEIQPDIKVIVPRFTDVDLSDEERIKFAEEVGADLYIRLGVDSLQDVTGYGITGICNGEYFIPEFGNYDFADIVLKNVTVSVSDRANGLVEAAPDSILKELQVPSVQIQLGNLSNEKERALLVRKDYQNLLADGLVNAIMETYEIMYQTNGTDEKGTD